MQFTIHFSWIRPALRVQVQFALLRHVEEIHDNHIKRQLLLAIPLRHIQSLLLRGVNRLTLDVPVDRPRQHVRHARQQPIPLVDLVAGVACDDEIRYAVSNLRRPYVLTVEAQIHRRFRRIVPDQTVALSRNYEGYTDVLASDRAIVMPTTDLVIPQVHPALLLLPQPVVVLVGVRVEHSRNTIAFCASIQLATSGSSGAMVHPRMCSNALPSAVVTTSESLCGR